jgi:hypothetical protein
MQITFAPSLPKKVFPLALFFALLSDLDQAGSGQLSDFLNANVARIDGGMVDGYMVSIIWFNDVADYLITTQECVARAVYASLQRVAAQFGPETPVRMVFGIVTKAG